MAVQTITYDDKQYLNQNSEIADVNKINDTDMNEIKTVVNNNATELTNVINAEVYSTNEVKTNKVWIDGKPIYRKVLTGTKNAGWTDISISAINYDTIFINNDATHFTFTENSSNWCKGPYYFSGTDFITAQIKINSNQINIGAGSGLSNISYKVVLEYTKTTD